jgi:hypothetical protein
MGEVESEERRRFIIVSAVAATLIFIGAIQPQYFNLLPNHLFCQLITFVNLYRQGVAGPRFSPTPSAVFLASRIM